MITLPRLPRGAGYALRFVRNSEAQRSSGGSLSPLNRAGDHFAIEVDPGVLGTACGRELLVDLARGHGQRLRAPIPEPGVTKGPVGVPRVNGSGQAGTSLSLDGFTPQLAIRKGWFFTLETAEGSSAHIVAAAFISRCHDLRTVREIENGIPVGLWDNHFRGLNSRDPAFEAVRIDNLGQYFVQRKMVLGARRGGWGVPTGTVSRVSYAAYAGQTVSDPPTQAEVQAIDDHLKIISRTLAALITDMHSASGLDAVSSTGHGLIGP